MKRLLFVCVLLTLLISGVLAQDTAYNAPAWTSLPLTNVATGETFTLADYAGKVVFVEPMATWCTNCRAQLGRLNGALNQFDNSAGNFLFLGVSVELGLDNAALASYQTNQGFNNINFAVASTEFLQGLIDTFGRAANTPPSTPHFYIFPDGSLGELVTGPESTEELVTQFQTIAAETSFAQPADPEPTEEAMMEATEEMTEEPMDEMPAVIPYSAILFRVDAEQSSASFFIGEDLNGEPIVVEGTTDQVAADVIVDFVDPSQSQIGTVLVNARTLATGNDFRDRALRSRILFSAEDQYEFISFEPTELEGLPEMVSPGTAYDVTIIWQPHRC